MGRFRSRAEIRAIFAKIQEARAEYGSVYNRSDLPSPYSEEKMGTPSDSDKKLINRIRAKVGLPPKYPEVVPKPKVTTTPKWTNMALKDWEAKSRTLLHERARFGALHRATAPTLPLRRYASR